MRNEVTGTQGEIPAFRIEGNNHLLSKNSALGNSGDGFNIGGTAHKVFMNIAEENRQSGINLIGIDTVIFRNTALDNGDGVNYFDLADANQDCDNNIWKRNTFVTRNQDCIQ